jgi:hypothetical protein
LSTRDQKYSRMSVSVGSCFTATLWQQSLESEWHIRYGLPRAPGGCGILECGGTRPRICPMTVQARSADQERSARAATPSDLCSPRPPTQIQACLRLETSALGTPRRVAVLYQLLPRRCLSKPEEPPVAGNEAIRKSSTLEGGAISSIAPRHRVSGMGGESGCAFFILQLESARAYDSGAQSLSPDNDVFRTRAVCSSAHIAWKPRGSLGGDPASVAKILSGYYG